MELADAIRSTGAVRQFTATPIDDATLYAMLDDARFAPSGGNRQGWRVVVVRDRTARESLATAMRPVWDEYVAIAATGKTPFTAVDAGEYHLASVRRESAQPGATPNELLDGIADIPVVLVVAADLAMIAMMDRDLTRPPITAGASIYPFCWNLLLAARSRGLGGVLTTFLARAEPTAAPALGLPATYAIAATMFLGHPVHQPTRLKRTPVESFTTIDRFDGRPFTGLAE